MSINNSNWTSSSSQSPQHRWWRTAFVVLIPILSLTLSSKSTQAVDFVRDIEPILRVHCIDCHGPDEQSSQFRVDKLANLLRGGNSGEPAVVPGDPAASFLLKLIRHEEPERTMPPDEKLSDQQIDLIAQWIQAGAKTPDHYGPPEEVQELTHWSFQPVKRSDKFNSIDEFIEHQLKENALEMSPEAERRVQVRRLYLIMLGLPPTPEQVDAFVSDESEQAWSTLVEQVLSSPNYGERWATHWLDLVRFGETHGYEMNRERPGAWHYRDWVIASLNQDKPYDHFVREQLAGDAIGAPVGTGFLVAGPYDQVKGSDPKLSQIQRMNELDDMINTTGTALLGLTTGCARCHNHKFDPISQKDYYAMQAIFAGVNHGEAALPLAESVQQEVDAMQREKTELEAFLAKFIPQDQLPPVSARHNVEIFTPREAKFVRFTINGTNGGQACIDELEIFSDQQNVALASRGAIATSSGDFVHPLHRLEHINDGKYGNANSWISAQARGGWVQIEFPEPVLIDCIEWARDREQKYSDRLAIDYRIESAIDSESWQLVASSDNRLPPGNSSEAKYDFSNVSEDEAREGNKSLQRLTEIKKRIENSKTGNKAWIGRFSQPGQTHRLYRGEPDAKREVVEPNAIEAFTSLNLEVGAKEQDRRLAFANWVTDPENPLTARVIVNRLWQFHFGTGIVDTPSDFGLNGTPPTHPELLDWLASELVENDWSLKHIHRLILNSKTWRQDNKPRIQALQVDANSRLLWRFPPRRLEAEPIRDSILSVSGKIQLDQRGGPGFSAFEVELENVRHYHPKEGFGPEDWRRMIYMTKVRQEKDGVFGAFDCPDASMVVPQRSRSTTPLQALNLLNSPFLMQQAEFFAERLQQEAEQPRDQIVRAWRLCFQRTPTAAEVNESAAFIQQEGLLQFARAMLNTNEFVFIP
ncbi:PSD1 and planctomycete cytochrome C domain-containing protein [Rubinisphaera sp.]|uniref:PSD1 and planctomycete cytochrome C domain-containing protein n=1 Tax=Rubinisphaera sp. TaxID=2024857 RepID=UPI000C0DDB06|nr:PSD1 and planctomycete cytochrome C domain-containing protein [Rubinisphaera sp.]MBV11772.1 hypothetical protein [Rubinisphaera sp.]